MNLTIKLQERKKLLEDIENLESVLKANKKEVETLEDEILEDATNHMISEVVVDGEKYKLKYDNKVHAIESVSDHSKKVELMHRLTELGYNEAVFFESAYYPKVALRKVWSELTPDTINQFAQDGLIYHETKPSITVSRAKK